MWNKSAFKKNRYRAEDIEYMPETFAAEVETLPIGLHLIIWMSVIFLVAGLIWANFATLDEVTHAEGQVIPSGRVQVVQNLEGGILEKILVKEGQLVEQGQLLLRLDDTRFASSYNEHELEAFALKAKIARLRAELEGETFVAPEDFPDEHLDMIEDERELYEKRRLELNSNLDILNQQLRQHQQKLAELKAEAQKFKRNAEFAEQELELTEPLVETGAVSRVEVLRLQSAVNEASGKLEAAQLAIPRAEAVIEEAEEKIQEHRQQYQREARSVLNEAKADLARLSISNVALQDRVNRTEVRSPVDGTVKQIKVNTVGSVIQPGMDLLEIVPANDTLLIEARVRPADIAFIHPGQKATVKLTAYDFSIYGGLESELEFISADTITNDKGEHFFEIRVRTEKAHLGTDDNPLPIIPGMVASVDIMTGQKTVMDYILKPLKRAQDAALSER
ncbi:MAG: HlyD family type I secretion periplasmic adaptor subunit [Pseudomonadales bacterium]